MEEKQQISLALPKNWIKKIDSKTTSIKTRQDLIREWIEPHVMEE